MMKATRHDKVAFRAFLHRCGITAPAKGQSPALPDMFDHQAYWALSMEERLRIAAECPAHQVGVVAHALHTLCQQFAWLQAGLQPQQPGHPEK